MAVLLALLLVALPTPATAHDQSAGGKTVSFDHRTGNEWWVEVDLAGASAGSVVAVDAMDTGGPWAALQRSSWGPWTGSFHIEAGHAVTFRASWTDGTQIVSCPFSHPAGAEQCPDGGGGGAFSATFSAVNGNAWWVEARVSASKPLAGVDARVDCGATWRPLTLRSWGAWAQSFAVPDGARVDFRARATTGEQVLSGGYLWPAATPTGSCGSSPPPPPPPSTGAPGSREAEAFAVRTAGGRQTSTAASGGALWNLWSNGHLEHALGADGATALTVVAKGTPASGVWPRMVVTVDGAPWGTRTVDATAWTSYAFAPAPSGTRTVRVAFTNDARTSTEDRNLLLDVVSTAPSGTAGTSFTLAAGATHTVTFAWGGGPGFAMPHVATTPGLNTGPSVRVAFDGGPMGNLTPVAGPVARPFLVPFTLPAGSHTVTYGAVGGTVLVSDLRFLTAPPPATFSGAEARVHVGGFAEGAGWRFTDFGYLDAPLVVNVTGWYDLRVVGVGNVATVGPLVHLWLNRTVVAEALQGATVDVRTARFLRAGVGYTLGASFEDPDLTGTRSVRFDTLSAVPGAAPAPLPPAPALLPLPPALGWPQYGRDAWNTRSTPDPTVPTAATAAGLDLLWRRTLDGSVTSTPAVVGGRVFLGTWANSVYCLSEATGAVLWRTTLADRVDDSPSVAGGLVLVGAGAAIVALDAQTGAVAWTRTFSGHFWSSPIVEGDSVFVGVDADRGRVIRMELATGDVVWDTPTTETANAGARVWASALVPPGSGLVVVGTSPGTRTAQSSTQDSLLAFSRETGVLQWAHQLFPLDTNAESTEAETLIQNRDISGTPHLAIREGRPVVLASQKHGPAWAVDLADGSLVHGSRLLDARAALVGSGGFAEGVEVVSATEPSRVAGFDLQTGDLLWQQPLPSTNFAPVAIGGGLVWIGSWEGHLHAFDLHTGREVVRLDAGGGVLGGAALANGKVIVGSLTIPASGQFNDSFGQLPGFVSAWG